MTADSSPSLAILGATGMVGKQLTSLALAEKRYRTVRTLVRRAVEPHQGLDQRVIDFDHLEDERDSLAVDDVCCCLGTTIKKAGSEAAFRKVDLDYPLAAARAALAAGAKQYLVVTAVGADPKSSIFYNRTKGELEAALAELAFPGGVTVLHPSLLLGDRQESRPGEAVAATVMRRARFLFAGPLARYRAIEGAEVARALLRAAERPAGGFRVVEGTALFELAGAPLAG